MSNQQEFEELVRARRIAQCALDQAEQNERMFKLREMGLFDTDITKSTPEWMAENS